MQETPEEKKEGFLLVNELQQGNEDALTQIYEKYYNFLVAFAYNLLSGDIATAEDIAQDVFVSFVSHVFNIKLRSSLRSYLVKCVVHRIIDIKRPRSVHFCQLDEAKATSSSENNPVQQAILTEETRRMKTGLALLPYKQREAVLLRVQAGMTFKEVADTLGIPIETAKSQCRYGLEKLRTHLNKKMIG